jgi:hypothetical protein
MHPIKKTDYLLCRFSATTAFAKVIILPLAAQKSNFSGVLQHAFGAHLVPGTFRWLDETPPNRYPGLLNLMTGDLKLAKQIRKRPAKRYTFGP